MKRRIWSWLLILAMAVSLLPFGVMATETGGDHIEEEEEETLVKYLLCEETDDYTVYTKEEYAWTLENGVFTSGNQGAKNTLSSLKIVFKKAGAFSFDWTVSCTARYGYFAYRVSTEDYAAGSDVSSQTNNKYGGELQGTENELIVAENEVLYLCYAKANFKDPGTNIDDQATITNLKLAPLVVGEDTVITDPIVYNESMGTVTAQLMETKYNKDGDNSYYELYDSFGVDGDDQGTENVEKDKTYRLKAVAKEGYRFYGWVQKYTYNGSEKALFRSMKYYTWDAVIKNEEIGIYVNDKIEITTPELEVTFDGISTYHAVFAPENSYVLRINSRFYDSTADVAKLINEATSGDVVEILQDVILTENVTVKRGVTLYVPFRAGWSEDESLGKYRGYGNYKGINETNHYVTLTVESGVTMTVKGTLAVGATIGQRSQGYQGNISGAHGHIANNGDIVITEKGTMVCYGLVTGSGTVMAQNYGIIKESLLILDFAGGSNTLSLYSSGQMPFERYNMQNIQCVLQLERYGTLTGMINLFAVGIFNEVDVDIVGATANSVFTPNDTGVTDNGVILTRTYDGSKTITTKGNATTAGVGKTTWRMSGGVTFQTLTINLGIAIVRTDGADFPINCHMDFIIENGIYEIPGRIKVMPGANVLIEPSATLKVGGRMIVLDQWIQSDMSGYRYPTVEELAAAEYSTVGNLYVNGTLQILSGATFGGVVQSTANTGILVVEEGTYLTNSGDLASLVSTIALKEQSGYKDKDWVQQIGGVGTYDDNTVWFNIPARICDGEKLVQLTPGTYTSKACSATLTDRFQERYCIEGAKNNTDGEMTYPNGGRQMIACSDAYSRTISGTWSNKTSAVEITTNTVAGSDKTGVKVEVLPVLNDDGTTTLTLAPKNADNSDVTVKYVHLVKYATASETVTVTATNGTYTIPADAKSVTIESAMLGDPNGDGKANSVDALRILRASSGAITLSEIAALAADVNGDGKCNSVDALRMLRYSSGAIESL